MIVEDSSICNSLKISRNMRLTFVIDLGLLKKKQTGEITVALLIMLLEGSIAKTV